MKSHNLVRRITALVLFLFSTSVVTVDAHTYRVPNYPFEYDDWYNPLLWIPSNVPSPADTIIIPGGYPTAPSATYADLRLTGGNLSGTFQIGGSMRWTGGGLGAAVTVNPGASLWIQNTNNTISLGGSIVNAGFLSWIEGGLGLPHDSQAAITNLEGGMVELLTDVGLAGIYRRSFFVENRGVWRKPGGSNWSSFFLADFFNSGTVDWASGSVQFGSYAQTAGTIRLNGGTLSTIGRGGLFTVLGAMNILGGSLAGSGTLDVLGLSFTNAGVIDLGPPFGTLSVTGTLGTGGSMVQSGTFNCKIGGIRAGTQFDQVLVAGPVIQGGVLNVCLTNGFRPSLGDSFRVWQYASRNGTFAHINGLDLGQGLVLVPDYQADGLVLRAEYQGPGTNVSLVSLGSAWRYHDDGVDLGSSWRSNALSDVAWKSGPSELGFGDAAEGRPEATPLSQTNAAGETNLTFYFRHSFDVPDPTVFRSLTVRLLRDDGAAVYPDFPPHLTKMA